MATGPGVGLVSTRLAVVDVEQGWQPLVSEVDGSVLVYNGEVYDHPELRGWLAAQGERCRTRSDTEVVLRLLVRQGLHALDRLNGQFALAWWQPGPRRLTLVRDRFGVRPIHYAVLADGGLVFASEAKALFASGAVGARPSLPGLDDVFTGWGARAPGSVFEGVRQVRPGGVVVWEDGRVVVDDTWWSPDVGPSRPLSGDEPDLRELLEDSVRLRLRADIEVGTYLSGGLDSSVLTAMAAARVPGLHSFSVAFSERQLDERVHQERVAAALGTRHHVVDVRPEQIAQAFRDVVVSAETPMVRTAPVPMSLLARAVREHGVTVVATGEGADELFWGYDLFKELTIRFQAASDPSALSQLDQLYPYLASGAARRGPGWRRFFSDAGPLDDPLVSHQTRAEATSVVKAFYARDVAAAEAEAPSLERLRGSLPVAFDRWRPLERAAYLELTTLLDPYLLSTQGDRVAMAHGVEGRYPFLDHRVFEHAARLPEHRKLAGLRDKVALREVAASLLPAPVAERAKQPYGAPAVLPFFGPGAPAWVADALSPSAVRAAGLFDPIAVAGLERRCASGRATGPREGMALVGVLSTQVWHDAFCRSREGPYPVETRRPNVLVRLPGRTSRPAHQMEDVT